MPTLQTVSTEVSPHELAMLQKMAEYKQCSSSDIIRAAINSYLSYDVILEAKIERGLEDLKAGRVVSHEEVKEEFRKLGVDVD